MARNNNRGTSNRSTSNRGGNNNPTGRNQYSGGVMDMARDRPMAAAAVAAGAAAAGLFLWSKRSQISDQLSNLSDQIGEWREGWANGGSTSFSDDTAGATSSSSSTGQRGMSETGGGNASLGAHTGSGAGTAS